MTIKDFFSFRQNRFFWANILAMAVVVVGLLFGVLKGLDIYTRHGEAVIEGYGSGGSRENVP